MAPLPCEACAAGQGVPPPPSKACWARRGIPANRSRCAAEAAVRSVPVPPCGETCHPSLGQGMQPPPGESKRRHHRFCGVPPPAHNLSTRFQATVCPTSPRVAARKICHLLLHCRLVDFNLLGLPPPCEACAARQGVPPPPGVACRYRRGARRAIHAPGQGMPPPPGDSRRRRQRCRGVPPQEHSLSTQLVARQGPVSRLA